MKNTQHIGNKSRDSQQIQAHGDVYAPFSANGSVSISGENHGVVITSMPTPEAPQRTFDIARKVRVPTPAALIGAASGLITITGFVTGGFSAKQLVEKFVSGEGVSVMIGKTDAYWWFLASILMIAFSFVGWSFFRFLRRNVLRLPKRWFLRAWAGIKEENGRTYPYSLRLAMLCPSAGIRSSASSRSLLLATTSSTVRPVREGRRSSPGGGRWRSARGTRSTRSQSTSPATTSTKRCPGSEAPVQA